MVGHVPVPHPAVHSQGQLRAGVQIHLGPGETKQGRTQEFNEEFYKTVERDMFREISPEEMATWDSPVNYIYMVEAFREGPHSTTPLRICMNRSLKQPKPVSLSLNDCLVKGPSALVDLFTVTLCIREHRYLLTKDLSRILPEGGPQSRRTCAE
jgi:hypothetical protein